MRRLFLPAVALLLLSSAARAHFVFVVPQKDGKSFQVVFSDSLEPDEAVSIDKVPGLKLTARSADGKAAPVACEKGEHSLTGKLGAAGSQLIHGSVVYGLFGRPGEAPTLLVYHPKAILGSAGAKAVAIGEKAALEVVPLAAGGKVKFRLLAGGKPVAGAAGSAILPGGERAKLTTDKEGFTAAFDKPGRYGVWLRHNEAKAGEHGGKKYEQVRHYATLVCDHDATAGGK